MSNTNFNYPQSVQTIEQRSIQFPNIKDHKHPGVQSLPVNRVDVSNYKKSDYDKKELSRLRGGLQPAIGYVISNSFNQKSK